MQERPALNQRDPLAGWRGGLDVVRAGGVEPPTFGSVVRCSIQLSYARRAHRSYGLPERVSRGLWSSGTSRQEWGQKRGGDGGIRTLGGMFVPHAISNRTPSASRSRLLNLSTPPPDAGCCGACRAQRGEGRRRWDSNPRYLAVRRFSKPLPSTTRPHLPAGPVGLLGCRDPCKAAQVGPEDIRHDNASVCLLVVLDDRHHSAAHGQS